MPDVVAGIIAVALGLVALSLVATLHRVRYRRERAQASERALGRRIIAEIPIGEDLMLFSEDRARFYWGDRSIDKGLILAVRVLINGAPIASYEAQCRPRPHAAAPTGFEGRPEGIARDRWDVAIETERGTILVECGAIRERVSQELGRAIYDAVRQDLERRDQLSNEQRAMGNE